MNSKFKIKSLFRVLLLKEEPKTIFLNFIKKMFPKLSNFMQIVKLLLKYLFFSFKIETVEWTKKFPLSSFQIIKFIFFS